MCPPEMFAGEVRRAGTQAGPYKSVPGRWNVAAIETGRHMVPRSSGGPYEIQRSPIADTAGNSLPGRHIALVEEVIGGPDHDRDPDAQRRDRAPRLA